MISEEQKEKNVKDLEYGHLLNKQNIFLAFFGSAILATLLAEQLPRYVGFTRTEILIFLIIGASGGFLYFGNALERKAQEIRSI